MPAPTGVWALLALFALLGQRADAQPAHEHTGVRLYAMDCGTIALKDLSLFSDTGEYDGKPGTLADPCFLIRHPRGTLLWDTGLGDRYAAQQGGAEIGPGIRFVVSATLETQLKTLGLAPDEVTYVAFSHFHLDHVGNANRFTHSTWIINQAELAAALGPNPPFGVDKSLITEHEHVHTQMIDGDYDVFGDGSVRILKAPGHTPGHQVLLVRLAHTGPVLLSGDLYHIRDNRRFRRVPSVNTERADTLASMDRFERLATNTKARVVIQHDGQDFHALPAFPGYLE